MNIFKQVSSDAIPDMDIVCVLDGYEPQLAQIVIDTIKEQSEDTLNILIEFACDRAYEETCWN